MLDPVEKQPLNGCKQCARCGRSSKASATTCTAMLPHDLLNKIIKAEGVAGRRAEPPENDAPDDKAMPDDKTAPDADSLAPLPLPPTRNTGGKET